MAQIKIREGALIRVRKALGNIPRAKLCRLMDVDPTTGWRVDNGGTPSPQFIAALILVSGLDFEDLFIVSHGAAA